MTEQVHNGHHTLEELNLTKMPKHIAVIMDGNGRWATAKGMLRLAGHRAGVETLDEVISTVKNLGIKYLTVYAFSTENWKRPADEIDGLMRLFVEFIDKKIDRLYQEGVSVRTIGDTSKFPDNVQRKLASAIDLTKENDTIIFNIALNYGGRQEITSACRQIAEACVKGELAPEEIDETKVASYLDTAGQPDPDLLIRSSGELRLSNFLLWQIAYSEIWITNTLWPDFSAGDLYDAIYEFQHRDRRFGGLKK